MPRDILIGVVGAITASLIAIAAEALFDALSSLLGPEVPRGAVIAFEDACPDGWKLYHNGKGRFLLGAGQSEDGKGKNYQTRSTGGHEEVTLKPGQMPTHNHNRGGAGWLVQVHGKDTVHESTDSKGHREINIRHGIMMSPAGNSQPHDNMPPYRVVNFCEKT